ncbi:testis-expressed protein 22 isoform X1 [Saimiri boliviensis]|uniref:testis-expressed protein 22 isoform X1 n=1 Tax=Saimiri boliviensis TaxID=27679 RepID=UPI000533FE38
MDGRKLAPQGKKLELQVSQEHRRPPLCPTAASCPPSTQSSAQQGLQTQDWVSEPPERRCPGRHWSVSIDERRRLAMLGGWERLGAAGGPHHCRVRGGGSSLPVPAPPRPPSTSPASAQSHWTLCPGAPRPHPCPLPTPRGSLTHPCLQDIVQIVAQLVSEDVDKDVLFPHPTWSSESTNAFQTFLARSAPFWHNVTFKAQASRSPHS